MVSIPSFRRLNIWFNYCVADFFWNWNWNVKNFPEFSKIHLVIIIYLLFFSSARASGQIFGNLATFWQRCGNVWCQWNVAECISTSHQKWNIKIQSSGKFPSSRKNSIQCFYLQDFKWLPTKRNSNPVNQSKITPSRQINRKCPKLQRTIQKSKKKNPNNKTKKKKEKKNGKISSSNKWRKWNK